MVQTDDEDEETTIKHDDYKEEPYPRTSPREYGRSQHQDCFKTFVNKHVRSVSPKPER